MLAVAEIEALKTPFDLKPHGATQARAEMIRHGYSSILWGESLVKTGMWDLTPTLVRRASAMESGRPDTIYPPFYPRYLQRFLGISFIPSPAGLLLRISCRKDLPNSLHSAALGGSWGKPLRHLKSCLSRQMPVA